MKIIPIFLFILLYVACKPTAKVSQPQSKRKNADIVGTYVDKFGRTLKLAPDKAGFLYFEYYCLNTYLGNYRYVDDSVDLYAEDSTDFCPPCVPTTGGWYVSKDTIFLTTFTYSNLELFKHTDTVSKRSIQNGMIVRQSNKLQDSFIVQVELSQDLPQQGYLRVYIFAFIDKAV